MMSIPAFCWLDYNEFYFRDFSSLTQFLEVLN